MLALKSLLLLSLGVASSGAAVLAGVEINQGLEINHVKEHEHGDGRGDDWRQLETTTIPYLGDRVCSTTIHPCRGKPTVVVQTPLNRCERSTEDPAPTKTTSSTKTTSTKTSSMITSKATSMTTSTTTKTTSSKIPEPTTGGACTNIRPGCAASGFDIEYFANPFGGYSRPGDLPASYYITQKLSPLKKSTTTSASFPAKIRPGGFPIVYPRSDLPTWSYSVGWTIEVNGGITVDANNYTLVYQGYYRAPETGAFQLCTLADNMNNVYFGHRNAFSCITGAADPAAAPIVTSVGGQACATIQMVKDQAYPLRFVMGNWAGNSILTFTIKTPSQAAEQPTTDFAGVVSPHSCGAFSG